MNNLKIYINQILNYRYEISVFFPQNYYISMNKLN